MDIVYYLMILFFLWGKKKINECVNIGKIISIVN